MTRKFELANIAIRAVASVVGKKEGAGPLAALFDVIEQDAMMGQKSWEQAEGMFLQKAFALAMSKSSGSVDCAFAGDLMNQSTTASFVMRGMDIPFFGIFGACSAYGEGLGLASLLMAGGQAQRVLVGAASHFCSAEKQFRFPLELGGQRPQTSTWTVTGAGAAVLELVGEGEGPFVRASTTGKVIDMGIKDMNNMGAAMAPAAADTIAEHLKAMGVPPEHYDIIATGDLGYVGQELLFKLLLEKGIDISANHRDCGIEMFDRERQDTHSGGSGCACSATVFNALFYPKLKNRELQRILLVPTGALGNQLTALQGESIPAIAHAIAIEA